MNDEEMNEIAGVTDSSKRTPETPGEKTVYRSTISLGKIMFLRLYYTIVSVEVNISIYCYRIYL